jgi:hypothetical protein
VRICQSYWRVTLTSAWKMITTPKLQISWQDTFELDVPSDLSQGTIRSSSCIYMVFERNVDNLSCMNYFRTLAIIDLSWAEPITKLLNSLT